MVVACFVDAVLLRVCLVGTYVSHPRLFLSITMRTLYVVVPRDKARRVFFSKLERDCRDGISRTKEHRMVQKQMRGSKTTRRRSTRKVVSLTRGATRLHKMSMFDKMRKEQKTKKHIRKCAAPHNSNGFLMSQHEGENWQGDEANAVEELCGFVIDTFGSYAGSLGHESWSKLDEGGEMSQDVMEVESEDAGR